MSQRLEGAFREHFLREKTSATKLCGKEFLQSLGKSTFDAVLQTIGREKPESLLIICDALVIKLMLVTIAMIAGEDEKAVKAIGKINFDPCNGCELELDGERTTVTPLDPIEVLA